jgi:transcriptional regulator with XRE-family HTH domain
MQYPIHMYFDHERFAELARNAHEQSAFSLREVSNLTYIDYSYISQILNGHRRPSRDVVISLCSFAWTVSILEAHEMLLAAGHKSLISPNKLNGRLPMSHL